MKVLITGGAGYIGATIASAYVDAGITPVILDDLSTGVEAYADGRILYRGDIPSPSSAAYTDAEELNATRSMPFRRSASRN